MTGVAGVAAGAAALALLPFDFFVEVVIGVGSRLVRALWKDPKSTESVWGAFFFFLSGL